MALLAGPPISLGLSQRERETRGPRVGQRSRRPCGWRCLVGIATAMVMEDRHLPFKGSQRDQSW